MRKMENWLIFSFITLVIWGVYGIFPKLATNYIDPKSVLIFQVIGSAIIAIILLATMNFKPEINSKGIMFAVLAGLITSFGTIFFFYALAKGKASVVVTITALYPIVTIILASIFLKETITLKQGIGMLFAVLAMIFFSI